MAKLNTTTVQDVTNKMSLGVASTTNSKNYFEESFSWTPQMDVSDIFAETVLYAANGTAADANVVATPSILEKRTSINLDEIPASNGQGYAMYSVPGDTSSDLLRNFIIPQKYGAGYTFVLTDNSSTTIPLTAGAYQFDYQNGILRFNEGNTPADMGWTTPLKLTAYRYIGNTLDVGTTPSSGIGSYTQTFTNVDLSGGMLTVTHNLNSTDQICHVTIKDNNSNHIEVDNIQDIDENIIQANLGMIIPIVGTWTVLVTCVGTSTSTNITEAVNIDIDSTTVTLDSFIDTTSKSIRWDYIVDNGPGINMRSGSIIAVWNTTIDSIPQFNEISTSDIGDTSDVTFNVDKNGNDVRLRVTALSDNWSVKVLKYFI